MSITTAVRSHLLTLAPVTALVGTRVRIAKLRQSEPTFPVLRIHRIGEVVDLHLRGSIGIKRARIQIDSITMDVSGLDVYDQVTALDQAVEGPGDGTGLLGFTGDIGGSPSVHVYVIRDGGSREGYDAAELKQFKVMHDYLVDFSE